MTRFTNERRRISKYPLSKSEVSKDIVGVDRKGQIFEFPASRKLSKKEASVSKVEKPSYLNIPDTKIVVIPDYLDPNLLLRKHPFRNIYKGGKYDKIVAYMSLIIGAISDRYFYSNYRKDKLHIPQFISSDIFKKITQDYRIYLDYLVDKGYLKEYSYSKGNYPKSYAFIPKDFDWHLKTIYLNGNVAKKENKKLVCSDSKDRYPYLYYYVENADFDVDKALELLSQGTLHTSSLKYRRQQRIILGINNVRNFKVDKKVGRLHTPFTNLKSEYRRFITFNRNKLANVDLKSSQPFFLACLMKGATWENFDVISLISRYSPTLSKDGKHRIQLIKNLFLKNDGILETYRQEYISQIESGLLYELIAGHFKCSRKDAKELVFSYLFSPVIYESTIVDYFKSNFPIIDRFRRSINTGFVKSKKEGRKPSEQSNTLALLLQKLESTFILDIVVAKLEEEDIPCLTIHDSFLVEEKHSVRVQEIIESCAIKHFGIIPRIKIE